MWKFENEIIRLWLKKDFGIEPHQPRQKAGRLSPPREGIAMVYLKY